MINASKYLLQLFLFITAITACSQKASKYTSPAGYKLDEPEKYAMPAVLLEISGITFKDGDNNMLYAEQDEEGKIFYLKPGDAKAQHTKFGKNGDYEDIAICGDKVIVLRSDGNLYAFPFGDMGKPEAADVKEYKNVLPPGEYEGLFCDNKTRQLYALCKNCREADASKAATGYILSVPATGTIEQKGSFSILVKDITAMINDKKIKFQPSALALHPVNNNWYILSSVNKLLVITDENWKVKEVHHLNPSIYAQPEGIAFDKNANLYISNEGGKTSNGNVLKMQYNAGK
ncbi:MAG TPA: SdiA-regulated domain-containing protein [Parafilimonas sp.]|nr:SdiA-regulated domain-containing protein [Parafilimonas sp.]